MSEIEVVSGQALSNQIKAENESQVDIAKRYPRDLKLVRKNVLALATCDAETAASCFYAKPVDNKGTMAEGPSIRLAEIVASSYQNIRYGTRVVDVEDRWVTVQGVAYDMENNVSYTVDVKRSIWSKKHGRYPQNLIQTTIKAAQAIARRDVILGVIPKGLFNAEIQKIKACAAGSASGESILKRSQKAIAFFNKMGVDSDRILAVLKKDHIESITDDDIATLHGIRNAIKDNEATVEESFPPTKAQESKAKSKKANEGVDEMVEDGKDNA